MLLTYLLFGVFIAGLSVYAFFSNPKRLRASAGLQGHDLQRATTQLSLDLELYDETELKGGDKEFQWGEYTLRELEERLTRDTQTLNLEGWKPEV